MLNELLQNGSSEKVDVNPCDTREGTPGCRCSKCDPQAVESPKLSPADETHLKVREDILKGNLDLEQTLWNAPLDLCIRLGTIVLERTREHFAKLEKSHG